MLSGRDVLSSDCFYGFLFSVSVVAVEGRVDVETLAEVQRGVVGG